MKVNELLTKLKGQYDTLTLIKDDIKSYIPWTMIGSKDWSTLKVKEYKIVEEEALVLDIKLKIKKRKNIKNLIVVWED